MKVKFLIPMFYLFIGIHFINLHKSFAGPKLIKANTRASASIIPLRCTGKVWKKSRKLKPDQLHQFFMKTSRQDLTQYLWYELSVRPKNNLALHMLEYLIETEKHKDLKSYYQVMGAAAYNDNTAIYKIYYKNKMKRLKVVNTKIKINEICQLYQKALRGKND